MDELQQAAAEWMGLERKTLKQREEANLFYDKHVMKLVEKEFIRNNKEYVFEQVDYLILSVGTSYEPIVLSINLFKPKKILFLYTEKTEKVLNKITKYSRLNCDRFYKREVHETEPIDIYKEIKEAYLKWGKPEKMYIDFTGGTKSMSVAAAMAGAMINVQLVYIGSDDYLVDFRKPNPGSEQLYYISNPMEIFGDLEIEKALVLFGEDNYSGAREKLEVLKESVPDPRIRQQLNFVYLLAHAYEAWDSLEFEQTHESMMQLVQQMERDRKLNGKFILMDSFERLKRQEILLHELSNIPPLMKERKNMEVLQDDRMIFSLMFTMFENARIREKQEKYDMATLLLYRLLELIEQRRLSCYGLFVSRMEYLNIQYDLQKTPEFAGLSKEEQLSLLKKKVEQIKKMVFGKFSGNYLPEQVSLLEGYIILLALGDEISQNRNGRHIDKLKRIRSMVYLRNNSIFAHGLGAVSNDDFQRFKQFVTGMFQDFCKIEQLDFEERCREIAFINPMESAFYANVV